MERRRTPRFEHSGPVTLTSLVEDDIVQTGTLSDVSDDGIRVVVANPVPPGTAVKIEAGQFMLLGEIRHCESNGEQYTVGIHLEHSLLWTEELARLAQQLANLSECGHSERKINERCFYNNPANP